MSRDEEERLRDISDALLFQLVVIGEATKALSEETRAAAPEVPWSAIAGLRDLITHQYFRIEIDRIAAIVQRDVPQLDAAVTRLLAPGV